MWVAIRTLGIGLVFTSFGVGCCLLMVRIPPGQVGVRANKWGGGITEHDFESGMHLGVPGMHDWFFLGKGTHVLNFTLEPSTPVDRPSLEIRTRDNNTIKVDVTVTYRIRKGLAHRLVREGLADDYRRRARSTVEDILRAELRALTSEDWFDTRRRLEEVERIAPIIDAAFRGFHVELDDVMIHETRFPENFERKLQEKQIYEQEALLAMAQRGVEDAEAVAGKIAKETESAQKRSAAEWDKELQEARSENQLAVATITARADRYGREKRAQADLAYERLVADGKLELDRALAAGSARRLAALSSPGGRIWLAREAARELNIEEVALDSTDPRVPMLLDLDELVGLLVGGGQ